MRVWWPHLLTFIHRKKHTTVLAVSTLSGGGQSVWHLWTKPTWREKGPLRDIPGTSENDWLASAHLHLLLAFPRRYSPLSFSPSCWETQAMSINLRCSVFFILPRFSATAFSQTSISSSFPLYVTLFQTCHFQSANPQVVKWWSSGHQLQRP